MTNRLKDAQKAYSFLMALDLESEDKTYRASKSKVLASVLLHTGVDLIVINKSFTERPKLFLPEYVDKIFPMLDPIFEEHDFNDEQAHPEIYTPFTRNSWNLVAGWGLINRPKNKRLFDAYNIELMRRNVEDLGKRAAKSQYPNHAAIEVRKALKVAAYRNSTLTEMLRLEDSAHAQDVRSST